MVVGTMDLAVSAATTTTRTAPRQGIRWVGVPLVIVVFLATLQSQLLVLLTMGGNVAKHRQDEKASMLPMNSSDRGWGLPKKNVVLLSNTNHSASLIIQKDTNNASEIVSNTNHSRHASLSNMNQSASLIIQKGMNVSQTVSNTNHSRHAYVFVIGGCDHAQAKGAHHKNRGYIFNILVSTRLLRKQGSQADVVGMFMMHQRSKAEALPDEDVRWLQALGIQIKYMPKTPMGKIEDFYEMQMRKFDILNLTEYSRVLHMDGDVMPITNLDYLFALSESGILQENVVVAGLIEPANGGFFMLAPGEGRLNELHDVIAKRKESDKSIPADSMVQGGNQVFDKVKGWGHVHQAPDEWVTRKERGRNWTFHAAYADQGLLYHYTKYVRKSVSYIRKRGIVSNWGLDPSTGAVVELGLLPSVYQHRSSPLLVHDVKSCFAFMCDFVHFTGKGKPWTHNPMFDQKQNAHLALWWSTLREINEELGMGLNFTHWPKFGRPTLGTYPKRVG